MIKATVHNITILPMQQEHVPQVVEVRMKSMPDFFLTFVGARFLRVLHSELLNQEGHVALIAWDEKKQAVVGFVAGSTDQSNMYGQLIKKRWFSFATASIWSVIRRPTIIPRLFRALLYPRQSQEASAEAILLAIGVDPAMTGRGIGKQLVIAFLNTMKSKGVQALSLETDREKNEVANRFYEKLGFQLARTITTPQGNIRNEYVIDLTTWSPA